MAEKLPPKKQNRKPRAKTASIQKESIPSPEENETLEKPTESVDKYLELFENATINEKKSQDISLVIEGQYKETLNHMMDAYNANLTCGLVGPVGVGKTSLGRYFAQEIQREFFWVTFSDALRPAHLLGSFDPTLAFKTGLHKEAFSFGPLTQACLEGGVFLANEVNRGDDFLLNIFLDPLEERRLYIPPLKTWIKVNENFYFIATMNPAESRGTRKIPEAFKSRIAVWLELDYPPSKLERQILDHNIQDLTFPLGEDLKNAIIGIIQDLRQNSEVETPPSLRSGISISRLAITTAQRMGKTEVTGTILRECAMLVLKESLEFSSPNVDKERILSSIINRYIG